MGNEKNVFEHLGIEFAHMGINNEDESKAAELSDKFHRLFDYYRSFSTEVRLKL